MLRKLDWELPNKQKLLGWSSERNVLVTNISTKNIFTLDIFDKTKCKLPNANFLIFSDHKKKWSKRCSQKVCLNESEKDLKKICIEERYLYLLKPLILIVLV